LNNFYKFDNLSKIDKYLIHNITQKDNTRPYRSSMALHTGEDIQSILSNRWDMAERFIGSDEVDKFAFVVATQTHSDHIRVVEEKRTQGWESQDDAIEDCDALITDLDEVVLTILTADCVPILLYDPVHRVVASIHAGWRGTKAKIVQKTISIMSRRFGSNPSDIVAGIAPSIGVCCYEVGYDVAEHFDKYPDAVVGRGDRYMLDLPLINKKQLIAAGLLERSIEMSDTCTSCSVDRYFSYRKESGCSGRFMSMIAMKPNL